MRSFNCPKIISSQLPHYIVSIESSLKFLLFYSHFSYKTLHFPFFFLFQFFCRSSHFLFDIKTFSYFACTIQFPIGLETSNIVLVRNKIIFLSFCVCSRIDFVCRGRKSRQKVVRDQKVTESCQIFIIF